MKLLFSDLSHKVQKKKCTNKKKTIFNALRTICIQNAKINVINFEVLFIKYIGGYI